MSLFPGQPSHRHRHRHLNLLFPRLDSAHPLRLRIARRKRGPTKTNKKKQKQELEIIEFCVQKLCFKL